MSAREVSRSASWPYWALVAALIAFGALAIFSIGLPFVALGLTLIAVAPLRGTLAFWPPIVAVIAFFAAWWLVGPVACAAEVTPAGGERRWCESAVGVTYEGNPLWIGPAVGTVAAALSAAATYAAIRRLRARFRRH